MRINTGILLIAAICLALSAALLTVIGSFSTSGYSEAAKHTRVKPLVIRETHLPDLPVDTSPVPVPAGETVQHFIRRTLQGSAQSVFGLQGRWLETCSLDDRSHTVTLVFRRDGNAAHDLTLPVRVPEPAVDFPDSVDVLCSSTGPGQGVLIYTSGSRSPTPMFGVALDWRGAPAR